MTAVPQPPENSVTRTLARSLPGSPPPSRSRLICDWTVSCQGGITLMTPGMQGVGDVSRRGHAQVSAGTAGADGPTLGMRYPLVDPQGNFGVGS